MGTVAHLITATDRKGKFSGYYKCSICDAEFRPNPQVRGELSKTFAAHRRFSHPAEETTHKDAVQPTEQIVDEGT